jgi:hypothetical protein
MSNSYGVSITIEVVNGGFILSYPKFGAIGEQETVEIVREVVVSPRKLNQKLKEVIDSVGLVTDNK